MLEDDELPATVDTALGFIVGAEAKFGSDDEISPEEEAAQEAMPYIVEPSQFERMLFWYLWLGVSVGTLDWQRRDGRWWPKLRALNPEFLWWDPETIDESTGLHGVYRYQHRSGVDEIVIPGNGRWVLWQAGENSFRWSAIRALAMTWLVKAYTIRDWARFNERHGLPINMID